MNYRILFLRSKDSGIAIWRNEDAGEDVEIEEKAVKDDDVTISLN